MAEGGVVDTQLADIVAACSRIEGRLDEIKDAHEIAIRGAHHRMDREKVDVEKDIDRVRADVRRPAAAAGGIVAVVVAGLIEAGRKVFGL